MGPMAAVFARVRRRRADTALSEGSDPGSSAILAARARQLTSRRQRQRTALALERLALAAERPSRMQVIPSRSAVTANREALLELAALLHDSRPVYAGGVAALELVIRDGTGPVYTDPRGEGLAAELACARSQLDGE